MTDKIAKMEDWNFGRRGKKDCKLLNYMDIGGDTYIKVRLKSRTTVS